MKLKGDLLNALYMFVYKIMPQDNGFEFEKNKESVQSDHEF